MKKWKERWNKLLPYEKKCEVASNILLFTAVIAFVFEVLDMINILPVAFNFYILTLGLVLLGQVCSAVVCWRTERSSAKASIGLAICFAIMLIWEIVKLFI